MKRIFTLVYALALGTMLWPCMPTQSSAADVALSAKDYSYAYWLNGWRKAPGDTSQDVLCFETGHYGFMLDIDDLSKPRFGRLTDDFDYKQSLAMETRRLDGLSEASLDVSLEVDGKKYRAVECKAGIDDKRQFVRQWESGRIAQHYDVQKLIFKDADGNALPSHGTLDIVGWPDSLTFTAELAPDVIYEDGPGRGVVGGGHCIIKKPIDIPHSPEIDPEQLTVECWFNLPDVLDQHPRSWILCKNQNEWAKGNFGFQIGGIASVSAVMNVEGGRNKQTTLRQRGGISLNDWHHLVLTYDGTTMRFYIDGHEQGKATIGKKRLSGNGILRLGKRADAFPGIVNGLYDQVRIWNRALSAQEVKAHAAKPAVIANRNGLVLERNFAAEDSFVPPVWKNATLGLAFESGSRSWQEQLKVSGDWKMREKKSLTLNCNLVSDTSAGTQVSGKVSTPKGQTFPLTFDPAFNGLVCLVTNLKRDFAGGYVKITDYDEFDISLNCNTDGGTTAPFMLDLRGPANITGLVPILCHPDGTPTGIPVQLSKNWHNPPMSPYLRAFALIPLKHGENRFRLRIPYGFYGTLPSASHGQLCLVGYGGNQRWDQLALACGGEAITFDVDMSLTDVAVCDVRVPLGRKGKNGNTWGWGDAGWGADWLGVFKGDKKSKLTFSAMKTAYLSHGPCLPDVRYKGCYGSARDVKVDAQIMLPRTDDYGRTIQNLKYRFQNELSTADSYLLKRHGRAFDKVVAYGNAEGLLAEHRITGATKKDDLLIPPTLIKGPGPWWVAFPERSHEETGYVSWIIRGYEASFGGKASENPVLQVRVIDRKGDEAKLQALLVPPVDVKTYQKGDYVNLDTEWVHLVTEADNYGGPNAVYRQRLVDIPRSWKTTYREVTGNALKVSVDGGRLKESYPVVVRAKADEVSVEIEGGVGYVPLRFEGLENVNGLVLYEDVEGKLRPLDQSVHGNDFWQTDYNAGSQTYSLSYNVPVDGKPSSRWVLRRAPDASAE